MVSILGMMSLSMVGLLSWYILSGTSWVPDSVSITLQVVAARRFRLPSAGGSQASGATPQRSSEAWGVRLSFLFHPDIWEQVSPSTVDTVGQLPGNLDGIEVNVI